MSMKSKQSTFALNFWQKEQTLPFLDLELMRKVADTTVIENDTIIKIVQSVDVATCSRNVQGGWPGHSHSLMPDLSDV